MENWLQIAVAVFLAAMTLYGHYKGFIRLAVSAVALIATFFIVQAAMPQVNGFLKENTGIYQFFENGVKKTVGLEAETDVEEPAVQRSVIEEMSLPNQLKEALLENNNYEVYHVLGVETFTEYVSSYLANSVLNIVGFLVLFAIVFALLHIITAWLDLVARLPILSGINKLAGAALGAAEGFFIIWILCLLLTVFSGTLSGRSLIAQIQAVPWLSYIYNHNFLGDIIMLTIKNLL